MQVLLETVNYHMNLESPSKSHQLQSAIFKGKALEDNRALISMSRLICQWIQNLYHYCKVKEA